MFSALGQNLITRVSAISERPFCECHGEPMQKDRHRANGTQKYACAVRARARQRKYLRARRANDPVWREQERARKREEYYNLSGYEYNRLLLKGRRHKALARMRKRSVHG